MMKSSDAADIRRSADDDPSISMLKSQLKSASATAAVLSERCEMWISQAQCERAHRESALSLMYRIGDTKKKLARGASAGLGGVMAKLSQAASAVEESESQTRRMKRSMRTSSEVDDLERECARLKRALARRAEGKGSSGSSISSSSEQVRRLKYECKQVKEALASAVRQSERDCKTAVMELEQWKSREAELEIALEKARSDKAALEAKIAVRDGDMQFAVEEWKQRDAALTLAHSREQEKLRTELRELQADFKRMERDFSATENRSKDQIESMRSNLASAQNRVRKLTMEKASLSEEIEKLTAVADGSARTSGEIVKRMSAELAAARDLAQKYTVEKETLANEIARLTASSDRANRERLESAEELRVAREAVRDSKERERALKESSASAQRDLINITSKLELLQTANASLQKEYDAEISRLKADLALLRETSSSDDASRSDLETRLKRQKDELAETKDLLRKMRSDHRSELSETKDALRRTSDSRSDLETRIERLVSELSESDEALKRTEDARADLEARAEKQCALLETTKEALGRVESSLKLAVSERDKLMSEIADLRARSERSHSTRTKSERALAEERDRLSAEVLELKSCAEEALTKKSRNYEMMQEAERAVEASKERERELEATREEMRREMASVAEKLRAQEAVSESLRRDYEAEIVRLKQEQRAESAELRRALEEARSIETRLQSEMDDVKARLSAALNDRDEERTSLRNTIDRMSRREDATARDSSTLICELKTETRSLSEQLAHAESSAEVALRNARTDAESELRQWCERERVLEDEVALSREVESEIRERLLVATKRSEQDVAALREATECSERDVEALHEANERWERDVEALREANERSERDVVALREANEISERDVVALREALERSERDVIALREANEHSERDIQALREANERSERGLEALRAEKERSELEGNDLREALVASKRQLKASKVQTLVMSQEVDDIADENDTEKKEITRRANLARDSMHRENAELRAMIEALEAKRERSMEDSSSREHMLKRARDEVELMRSRTVALSAEIADLNEVRNARGSTEDEVARSVRLERDAMRSEVSTLRDALEEAKRQNVDDDDDDTHGLRAELESLECRHAQSLEASSRSEDACRKLAAEVEALRQHSIEDDDRSVDLEHELDSVRARVEHLSKENESMSSEIATLKREALAASENFASKDDANVWKEAFDEQSGKSYWWNTQTNQTSWTKPEMLTMSTKTTTPSSSDDIQRIEKELDMWKERAATLESALEETKRLGVTALEEMREGAENSSQETDKMREDRSELENQIVSLKQERAMQVYEMGQSKMRNAIASRASQNMIHFESVEIAALRRRAFVVAIRRLTMTTRLRLQRRGWQRWRAVVRWCHYFWFKKRDIHFRFRVGLVQCEKVCRAMMFRRLGRAFREWNQQLQVAHVSSSATISTTKDDVSSVVSTLFKTPATMSHHTVSFDPTAPRTNANAASDEIHALRSALATREKDRRRKRRYQRLNRACQLLRSALIRKTHMRKAKAWARWESRVNIWRGS